MEQGFMKQNDVEFTLRVNFFHWGSFLYDGELSNVVKEIRNGKVSRTE